MAENQVRKHVLWLPNPDPNRDVPCSFHDRVIVLPSRIGQSSPLSGCSTRSATPSPGTYEECILVLNPGGKLYAAYPIADAPTFQVPGVTSPVEITWEANKQRQGEVIATVFPEGCPHYFRVFPGLNERHDEIVPAHYSTEIWESKPQAGETTRCWVAWHVGERSVVGYAYPHTDAIKVTFHEGVSFIGGVGIFIPREVGWEVSARRQGEEVLIILAPSDA